VETGAGDLLISEALRCYEVLGLAGVGIIPLSLRLQAQLYCILIRWCIPPLSSFPYNPAHKNPRVQNPSVPINMGRLNKRAGMSAYGHSFGECNGWPVSRQEPMDTTVVIRPGGA